MSDIFKLYFNGNKLSFNEYTNSVIHIMLHFYVIIKLLIYLLL